jgi:hypothetical protein
MKFLLLFAPALLFATSALAQRPFPIPNKDLQFLSDADYEDHAKYLRLGENYKDYWALGKTRWKALEARFKKPSKGYIAMVEKVEFDATGKCLITFRAWYLTSGYSMQSETFSVGPRIREDDNVSEIPTITPKGIVFTLKWDKPETPPPFAVGTRAIIGVDAAGKVVCSYISVFDINAVRLDANGKVEVILQLELGNPTAPPINTYFGQEVSKKLMYIKPDFTNLQLCGRAVRYTNVLWDAEGGIVVAALDEEAGDDLTESMIGSSQRAGIPVENHPTFRFRIGAEGWKRFNDLPYNIGSIGFEYLIPESQFITIRDGYGDLGAEVFGPPPVSVWIFPDSSTRLLTEAEVRNLDQETLWRGKNEMYARKGYIFSTPRGKAYTASLGDAYVGRTTDQAAISSSFNPTERKNLALLVRFLN